MVQLKAAYALSNADGGTHHTSAIAVLLPSTPSISFAVPYILKSYPVLVHHVADDDKLAILGAIVNHGHPADLHIPLEGHYGEFKVPLMQ